MTAMYMALSLSVPRLNSRLWPRQILCTEKPLRTVIHLGILAIEHGIFKMLANKRTHGMGSTSEEENDFRTICSGFSYSSERNCNLCLRAHSDFPDQHENREMTPPSPACRFHFSTLRFVLDFSVLEWAVMSQQGCAHREGLHMGRANAHLDSEQEPCDI